jgi:hypothetical protein
MTRAIERIIDRDGSVKPSTVLQAAKPKNSALHSWFEWDDQKAGHQYRLWQGRQLIRRVVVDVSGNAEKLIHVPRIKNEEKEREGEYKPTSFVIRSQSEFERALDAARTDLSAAQARVDELEKAADQITDEGLAKILLASKALSTANEALRQLH